MEPKPDMTYISHSDIIEYIQNNYLSSDYADSHAEDLLDKPIAQLIDPEMTFESFELKISALIFNILTSG